MQTVVVGIDVCETNLEPLRWAADYCRVTGGELVGVVGYQPTQAETPPDEYEARLAAVGKQAEQLLEDVAPAVAHRVEVREGDPRAVLADAATDDCATTVVVGANGNGGFHHLGFGTVAHHLARHLSMPVVSIPSSSPPLEGSAVVVGLDGSPGDIATLEWAAAVARASRGRVIAVYASDPMAMSFPHPPGATIADRAAAAVQAQVTAANGRGLDVTAVVDIDYPAPALKRVADEQNASVIVVGRKGAGHLRGLLLGHVPSELPFEAHRPVAIVPRATAA